MVVRCWGSWQRYLIGHLKTETTCLIKKFRSQRASSRGLAHSHIFSVVVVLPARP
jgi:hypothetical protein